MIGWHRVPDRMVGIVYRRYGRDARDTFRVSVYGSTGPQAAVLRPNTRHYLSPLMFHVRYVPQVHVPDNSIGLVYARDGAVRPHGRRFSQYRKQFGYFEDGAVFLLEGGEQGRQLGYLPGGAYYSINTELFEVITVETTSLHQKHQITADSLRELEIREGNTGVVIILDGREPERDPEAVGATVEGHRSFRLPWVFLGRGGQRGVQGEALGAGSYAIHPWFARVVQIPSRDLHLDWTSKSEKSPSNYDAALEQIVVNIHGHRLRLEVSQVLRIPPEAAPRLVRRFGEAEPGAQRIPVQRFVERVLGTAVTEYFAEIVGKYRIMEFIVDYNKVRMQLEDAVRQALNEWGVESVKTGLGEWQSEDNELDRLRRELAGQDVELMAEVRRRKLLEAQRDNNEIVAAIERVAIDLQGEREVIVLRKQIKELGAYNVVLERVVERMANFSTPDTIVGGGDLADRILSVLPFANAQEMLKGLVHAYSAGTVADSARTVEQPPEPAPPKLEKT